MNLKNYTFSLFLLFVSAPISEMVLAQETVTTQEVSLIKEDYISFFQETLKAKAHLDELINERKKGKHASNFIAVYENRKRVLRENLNSEFDLQLTEEEMNKILWAAHRFKKSQRIIEKSPISEQREEAQKQQVSAVLKTRKIVDTAVSRKTQEAKKQKEKNQLKTPPRLPETRVAAGSETKPSSHSK